MAKTAFCAACGATRDLYQHHLRPRARGGKNGPTVTLCASCHGAVHDKDLLAMNTLAAEKVSARRAQGKRIGQYIPFGFKLDDDGETLRRDEEGASWVRRIFDWYADGNGSTTICQRLSRAGVLPAGGGRWYDHGVLYILSNRLYVERGYIGEDLFACAQKRRSAGRKKHAPWCRPDTPTT
jgi:hypothetical protein